MKYNNKGFTLIELLLAAAITSIALAGIVSLFVHCNLLNIAGRSLTLATSHAEYIMEDVRNTPFSSIATNIDNGNWNWNAADLSSEGLTPLNGEDIIVKHSGVNPLYVIVTVNWQDAVGINKSTFIETLITS